MCYKYYRRRRGGGAEIFRNYYFCSKRSDFSDHHRWKPGRAPAADGGRRIKDPPSSTIMRFVSNGAGGMHAA